MSLSIITGIADECEKKPEWHSLCGKCMTPHICAEDGPGCKPAAGVTTVLASSFAQHAHDLVKAIKEDGCCHHWKETVRLLEQIASTGAKEQP